MRLNSTLSTIVLKFPLFYFFKPLPFPLPLPFPFSPLLLLFRVARLGNPTILYAIPLLFSILLSFFRVCLLVSFLLLPSPFPPFLSLLSFLFLLSPFSSPFPSSFLLPASLSLPPILHVY